MASENTLKIRSMKGVEKAMRRDARDRQAAEIAEAQDRQERGRVAAQFITSLARDLYVENVGVFPPPEALTAEDKLEWYRKTAHACMDASIAFVRASNSYDDRANIAKDAEPILAPTDANGTPVTE